MHHLTRFSTRRRLSPIENNSARGGEMKDLNQPRSSSGTPVRSVSLHVREYQVTLKVRSAGPEPRLARSSARRVVVLGIERGAPRGALCTGRRKEMTSIDMTTQS